MLGKLYIKINISQFYIVSIMAEMIFPLILSRHILVLHAMRLTSKNDL